MDRCAGRPNALSWPAFRCPAIIIRPNPAERQSGCLRRTRRRRRSRKSGGGRRRSSAARESDDGSKERGSASARGIWRRVADARPDGRDKAVAPVADGSIAERLCGRQAGGPGGATPPGLQPQPRISARARDRWKGEFPSKHTGSENRTVELPATLQGCKGQNLPNRPQRSRAAKGRTCRIARNAPGLQVERMRNALGCERLWIRSHMPSAGGVRCFQQGLKALDGRAGVGVGESELLRKSFTKPTPAQRESIRTSTESLREFFANLFVTGKTAGVRSQRDSRQREQRR